MRESIQNDSIQIGSSPTHARPFFLVNVANREHAVNPSFAAVAAAAATRLWVAALG